MKAARPERKLHGALLIAAWVLSGCANLWPEALPPLAPSVAPHIATQWQTPLPHGGQVGELARWWGQFDDPLLAKLVEAGQQVSPTLALARSRIEQARSNLVAAGAALGPSVGASASAAHGRVDLNSPAGSSASATLQARWEWDAFGAASAGVEAAQARLVGAQSSWHVARVSVAAEIGLAYLNLRACEAQLAQTRQDADSRAQSAALTERSAVAGFQAPSSAALARASAAQGQASVTQTLAQCDAQIKSLVALTALDEPTLRAQLGAATARLPEPALIGVHSVPAQALAQRPDIDNAARELAAASFDAAQAQAQRYPSIALSGSIGPARFDSGRFSASGTLWSLGPLTISLPLFDGGTRGANLQAARARYDAALWAYRASLRSALREVEDALLSLQSTAARGEQARSAASGFAQSLLASQARYQGGLSNLFELEDARRSMLVAQSALIELQRERVAAWVALYRALGGGWSSDVPEPLSATQASPKLP